MIDDTLGNLDGDAFTPGMDMYFFLRDTCFYDGIWDLGGQHRGDRSRINQPLGLLGYDRNESSHNSKITCVFCM